MRHTNFSLLQCKRIQMISVETRNSTGGITMTIKGFPEDFLWGGAVAAHQMEGAWNIGGERNQCCRCNECRGAWST